MTLSRRGFLTGLLSTAAVISTGPVAKIVAPAACNVLDMGGTTGGTSIWQISWGEESIFQMFPSANPVHYVSRIADIECPDGEPPDLFEMLARDVTTFVHGNPDWEPQPYQLQGLRALERCA